MSLQSKLHPISIFCLKILIRTSAISPGPLTTVRKKKKKVDKWSPPQHCPLCLLFCRRITDVSNCSIFLFLLCIFSQLLLLKSLLKLIETQNFIIVSESKASLPQNPSGFPYILKRPHLEF